MPTANKIGYWSKQQSDTILSHVVVGFAHVAALLVVGIHSLELLLR